MAVVTHSEDDMQRHGRGQIKPCRTRASSQIELTENAWQHCMVADDIMPTRQAMEWGQ
jgi:hypothetical protein